MSQAASVQAALARPTTESQALNTTTGKMATLEPARAQLSKIASVASRRLLAPAEVKEARDLVLTVAATEPGVGLALVEKVDSGKVLTAAESLTLARIGDPLFHESGVAQGGAHRFDSTFVGVRDPSACGRAKDNRNPSACACARESCVECGACPYLLPYTGGQLVSAFQPPRDRASACGCSVVGDDKEVSK